MGVSGWALDLVGTHVPVVWPTRSRRGSRWSFEVAGQPACCSDPFRCFSLVGFFEAVQHGFFFVNKSVTLLVTFIENHLHEVVVLAIGFFPLGVLTGFVFFEFWLARPTNMTVHPFVRFPWWLILTVPLFTFFRQGNPVEYVLFAFGSIYLGAHLVYRARLSRGYDQPSLPEEYNFSHWPAVVGLFFSAGLCTGYLFGWIDFCPTVFGMFRAVQAAYGAYFLLCYFFSRLDRQIEKNPAAWNGPAGLAVVGVVRSFKNLNPRARTALVTGGTAGVTAVTVSTLHHQIESRKLDVEFEKLDFEVKKLDVEVKKFDLEVKKFDLEKKSYSSQRVEDLNQKGIPYYFDEGVPIPSGPPQRRWFWQTPSSPKNEKLPVSVSDPPVSSTSGGGKMFSPLEEFVGPTWLLTLTLETGFVCLILTLVALGVIVAGCYFGVRLFRGVKR